MGVSCESKFEIQKQYRFSIAYENSGTMHGLITEKLFDCFAAGTVPVYLGAPNVTEHIPAGCYIDFREFMNYQHLYEYRVKMPEQRYREYLEAVRDFLNSQQYYLFTSTCYAKNLSRQIRELRDNEATRPPFQVKWTLVKLIICNPAILRYWRRFRRFLATLFFNL